MKFVLTIAFLCLAPLAAVCQTSADDALHDKVRLAIGRAAPRSGGSLEIQVENGIVTLNGYVRHLQESQKAERAAKRVKGVKRVVNELKVDPDRGAGANRS